MPAGVLPNMKVNTSRFFRTASITGALLFPFCAQARADTIQHELGQCAAVTDINVRVACYDNVAHSQPGKAQAKARPESRDNGEAPILAKVTLLEEIQPNKLRITLTNGQVWQQTIGKAFFIRANDAVRITGSSWGRSSRLAIDGHPGYIQVSRLQ
jgi:hypothetical protein